MDNKGKILGINGNMITAEFSGNVKQNEVAYVVLGESRLKSEVIRVKGNRAELQVFENTEGIMPGDIVEFTGEMLSVELGPGLLGRLYDGLQNPLNRLAEAYGFFLERGRYISALPKDIKWEFTPKVKVGEKVRAGDTIGTVEEGIFEHKIMVPFYMPDVYEMIEVNGVGKYDIKENVATLRYERGSPIPLRMSFHWPVKIPIDIYEERLFPSEQLVTRIRLIDTLFPISRGGTYCIPGPFGSGKTVLQQITSRNAKVDIVVIAACGERANEVVETIKEFPKLKDPFTGRSLMERTIIVCNTSSMPIAARESSVYTAITMAEYYRQMGLNVLLLADSTSRWAQAMRERSGRLEEIPGEEAFPAYLESVIANFYERAGLVRLKDGSTGSVTVGGTVSPAGGNFEEPVTQATLKVVGAFHALSQERSDARRYPAIDPLDSWTKYKGFIDEEKRKSVIDLLLKTNEIDQMMKVVGEEGTSLDDFILYMKGEFFDNVFLQQNAFDEVDAATSEERQMKVFNIIDEIIHTQFDLNKKDEARSFFNKIRQLFLDLNSARWDSDEFEEKEKAVMELVHKYSKEKPGKRLLPSRKALLESDMDSHFKRSKEVKISSKEDLAMEIRYEEDT